MKTSRKVFWAALISSLLVLATVITLIVYFVVIRNPSSTDETGSGLIDNNGEGTTSGGNGGFDHRSHSVPGGPYEAIDFEDKGEVEVVLDGAQSHSHYYKELEDGKVEVGKIAKFNWIDNSTGDLMGEDATMSKVFKRGVTKVDLRVEDNTGDVHTDFTTVTVSGSVTRGAFCYSYEAEEGGDEFDIEDDVDSGTKPDNAVEVHGDIDLEGDDAFPAAAGMPFVLRCVFRYTAEDDGKQNFKMEVNGLGRLLVDGEEVIEGKSSGDSLSGSVDLDKGTYDAQAWYYHTSKSATPKLTVDAGEITFDRAKVIPVITRMTPRSSVVKGGGDGKISGFGLGLGNGADVYFGDSKAKKIADRTDNTTIWFEIPKAVKETETTVTVKNDAGTSNSVNFEYSASGSVPLEFESSFLKLNGKKWDIPTITGIVYGPDHNFYISSLNGLVYRFKMKQDLEVEDICHGESVGENRAVLGMAFNPANKEPDLYVASSVLDWKVKFKLSGPLAWANGKVHLLRPSSENCIDIVKDVITGLPVSNHDHGINQMVFGQDGRLHIQVGGFTNAGYNKPGNSLGGIDENPLSAASVVADVTDPDFNGVIKYTKTDPGTADIASGDVKLWSTGWRNSYGIMLHSNGKLYASDNGPSVGFGTKSVSCSEDEPLVTSDISDKVSMNEAGKYYGHPNRNRGRKDPTECIFFPADSKSADFAKPIGTFTSSTDGLMEYTSNVFDGQLKHNILVTKYSPDENPGFLYRMSLLDDGDVEFGPDVLWEASGLTVAMSPWGDIVMPRVFKKEIMVLRPKWKPRSSVAFTAVVPFRGPPSGGNTVMITGQGYKGKPSATFDGAPCTDVSDVASDGTSFMCKAPKGKPGGKVNVKVTADGNESQDTDGIDYWYSL